MLIRVTKNDIKLGQRSHASACPVARALRRATGAREIGVDGLNISVGSQDFSSPIEVTEFVQRFDLDGRQGLKPFTFELRELKKKRVKATKKTARVEEPLVLVADKKVR